MGLGDFLRSVDDGIDNFIADHSDSYRQYLDRDADQMRQAQAAGEHPSFFKTVGSETGTILSAAEKPIRAIPGGDFVLDAASRSWDTLFITAQHAEAVGRRNGDLDHFSWGAFANGDSWGKAWNSWGQEDHVTAGQITAARRVSDAAGEFDPFVASEAQAIQDAASETWYGELLAATTDLGFSMAVPGAGTASAALKANRASKAIDTGADAERLAQRFEAEGADAANARKVGDTFDNLLGRQQNDDSFLGRMATSMSATDDIHDMDTMLAHIAPRMENSSDAAKVMVADLLTQANRVEDPTLRSQVKINTMLAAHGSTTARAALVRDFPLLAKNMEEMTGAPRDIQLANELVEARLAGASDPTVNGVLERHYNRPSDKAELEALKHEVEIAQIEARTARELRAETLAGSNDRLVAEELVADADAQVAVAKRQKKAMQVESDWNRAEAGQARPGLNRANDLLNEIFLLGESELATGRVIPTGLDNVKTRLRLMAGDETEMRFGDANTPVIVKSLPTRAARFMMAPHARGSISLVEVDLGQRQVADALRRSSVYQPDEIRAAQQRLLQTPPAKRQTVIAEVQQDMLERIAMKHFGDGRTPEEALAHAKEITQAAIRSWGQGNEWVTKALGEQKGSGKITFHTPDGVAVTVDEAMLSSQLADNAPFLDPEVFEKAIIANKGGIRNNIAAKVDAFVDLNDTVTALWKHGALLRPGLAVRAALDTEMRAMALMSTAETFMAAVNGASNMARNRGSAVSRVLFRKGDVAQAAMKRISMDMTPVRVDVGGGKKQEFAFSRTADERTRNQTAMTKGADTPWKFYFTETQQHLNRFRTERASWSRYKADSPHWVASYLEYAEQLLASPTARWVAKHKDDQVDLTDLMESAEFKAEYAKVGNPKGYTRWEFARQVLHEVDTMFPDGDLVDAVQAHTLTPKMVEARFPRGARFDVPGPERGVINNSTMDRFNELVGKAYRTLLDKPDMWLSRNPTGTMLYRRSLQREADALRRAYPDGDIPERMLDVMDKRARTEAISQVRRTFFDTTRYTSMHEKAARISPFFAAWEDAMISWSRLIYDDPRRLAKLGAAYNAAGTVNPYLPQPLLVDNDGQPLRRGQSHENGAYIALPFKVKGTQMRVRIEALNSIAQGETWWLPGFGPQATVAASQVLTRFLPDDVALDIVGTDNWMGQQILRSMYLDGELPRTDVGTTLSSLLPSTVRNLYKDVYGDNFAMNVQRNANYRIAQATKQGKRLTDAELRKIYDDAGKTAYVAATVRAISGGGFGMTGTATVDGQFYVEEMRLAEAVPPDELKAMGFNSPEEYFAHLHPEAADLDWHISTNETGIRASVNAQKASSRLGGVLKDYPDEFGWLVLGRENLNTDGGDDFSRTAYNMQAASGARKKRTAEEIETESRAAVGWREYRKMQTDLTTLAAEFGLPATHPALADVKREYTAQLMQENSAWANEFSTRTNRFDKTLASARNLAKDKRLKDRSDMVAFRDYDEARLEVMAEMGLKTLQGTGPEALAAKDVLREVGEELAKKDYGFQQMWDRFLADEVEATTPTPAAAEPATPTQSGPRWVSA